MYSLNRAMILGNVTRDPEMKYTPNGQAVCRLGVATNRRWKTPSGETQEKVEFHDVTLWRQLAEITSQYVKKGQKVYIEGRLETRSWESPDGTKRQKTDIVADNLIMLSPKGDYSASSAPVVSPKSEGAGIDAEPKEDMDQTAKEEKPRFAEASALRTRLRSGTARGKSANEASPKNKKDEDKKPSDDINLDEIPF